MIGFALDVTAVVVGLAVYSLIRRKFHERTYYSNYNDSPWFNW
jgi:hypothetical protein